MSFEDYYFDQLRPIDLGGQVTIQVFGVNETGAAYKSKHLSLNSDSIKALREFLDQWELALSNERAG